MSGVVVVGPMTIDPSNKRSFPPSRAALAIVASTIASARVAIVLSAMLNTSEERWGRHHQFDRHAVEQRPNWTGHGVAHLARSRCRSADGGSVPTMVVRV